MTTGRRGRAVVVGVSKYASIGRLPSAVRHDAEDLAELLVDPKIGTLDRDDVLLLLDDAATTQAVQDALCASVSIGSDDPFLFFFSGHGHRELGAGGERSWLMTTESNLANLRGSALAATDLSDLLGAVPSRRQVVLIDACHADAVAIGKVASARTPKGLGAEGLELLARGGGRATLASCRADEVSLVLPGERNSLFTAALLEAMRGEAQDRGDGVIRVLDVFHHVAEKVPRRAQQHPVLRAENLDSNFALIARKASSREHLAASSTDAEGVMSKLYPIGPTQDAIWSRAGGDVSRLSLLGSGRAQWHAALRRIEAGGDLTMDALLAIVSDDHPENTDVVALLASSRNGGRSASK